MTAPTRPIADTSAPPTVEVRLDGMLLKRVSEGAAHQLVKLNWGEWRGAGRRRAIHLTSDAPVSSIVGCAGKGDRTQPVRGDSSCKRYGKDVLMGNPRFLREHIPLKPSYN